MYRFNRGISPKPMLLTLECCIPLCSRLCCDRIETSLLILSSAKSTTGAIVGVSSLSTGAMTVKCRGLFTAHTYTAAAVSHNSRVAFFMFADTHVVASLLSLAT